MVEVPVDDLGFEALAIVVGSTTRTDWCSICPSSIAELNKAATSKRRARCDKGSR